jgi:hypothetical protein
MFLSGTEISERELEIGILVQGLFRILERRTEE